MSNGRGKHKSRNRKRTTKISRGENGITHYPLSEVDKALLGKGVVESTHHVPLKRNWTAPRLIGAPYDVAQAKENRRLYPHLFEEN